MVSIYARGRRVWRGRRCRARDHGHFADAVRTARRARFRRSRNPPSGRAHEQVSDVTQAERWSCSCLRPLPRAAKLDAMCGDMGECVYDASRWPMVVATSPAEPNEEQIVRLYRQVDKRSRRASIHELRVAVAACRRHRGPGPRSRRGHARSDRGAHADGRLSRDAARRRTKRARVGGLEVRPHAPPLGERV